MALLKTVLVVDDSPVNRKILSKILSEEYLVEEAEDGQAALALLSEHSDKIAAVMLDLVMPVMDGFSFLEAIKGEEYCGNLPVIVTTNNGDDENEMRALALGAWDFVSKPYHPQIIRFRVKNAIDRSQLSALKQLKYLSEYDSLTGIYNKTKFFETTREMIDAGRAESFVFFRFDVDRFHLINSFFGTAEGDRLLIYIANHIAGDAKSFKKSTYGRIESDVFVFCMPYDKKSTKYMIERSRKMLEKYNPNYDIVPSVGVYVIDDNKIPIEEMYNRATLAAKTCKGNYLAYYAYYSVGMSAQLTKEQEITNDMTLALENGQFEIYLQPQYSLRTNQPCGAEALTRWQHPQKGMLLPRDFIPVFECNGFICKLDYYVWEQTCRRLHSWKLQGIKPYPISVNVSRVNIYNPQLVKMLLELVERYQIEPQLLSLELTESAYIDNPAAMKKAMARLRAKGFTIMMDDFGSGYSSLCLLKDIEIDILKIDMRFLSKSEIPGRGENIIASVIRMAKQLDIEVIAEGAETAAQVEFLRSVGCDYVQGFYFARPMRVEEYEKLCKTTAFDESSALKTQHNNYRYDKLFSDNEEIGRLFGNVLQAAAIYEFANDRIEIIRVNEAYYALLGHKDIIANKSDLLSLLDEDSRTSFLNAFRKCARTGEIAECEYMRYRTDKRPLWIHTKLRFVALIGEKYIFTGELTDITMRKEQDTELQKYKTVRLSGSRKVHTVLIIDDVSVNRKILMKILNDKFLFAEAKNGEEAIRILQEDPTRIDLILLDINMPIMDGKVFLQYKQKTPSIMAIPVIMITADDSAQQQISSFSLGADDYIVKPFIPEVVTRRVSNVLEASHRFRKMVREYNTMAEQAKTDSMTGLFNRASVERMIAQYFESSGDTCAMVMLDIDYFKKINDLNGHDYGDKVICAVAGMLRQLFRKDDAIARMGGDEFAVFIRDMPDMRSIENKAQKLCASISAIEIDGKCAEITCSIGIAGSSAKTNSFETLYRNADKALYSAKCHGRNAVSVYGEEMADTKIAKWINDAESIYGEINDIIYACDRDSYVLLYANDSFFKFAKITKEACRGKKCYEVLMHKTAPCEFCTMSKMAEDRVYTRLFKMPQTSRVFLMRGKNIRCDGAIAHLELAVDVSNIDNMELYTEEMKGYEEKR
ncbi:MAG: EAL domain-containing protein [Oscillospiraceae bacterium]